MSKQTINIGASPNDGTGTPLRTSFDYTNQNFTELYTALGGGVGLPGATTQVIFNDGGTNLAGDAGLVYNKTTDTLTAGNATITGAATVGTTLGVTGDLTVDTNVLKVDSTLNKVGIGVATLTGLSTLNVAGDVAITSDLVLKNGSGTAQGYIFGSSGINYRVITGQPHVWQESGNDLMRLNSTGLGIGAAATSKLTVNGEISVTDNFALRLGSNQAGGATLLYNGSGNLDITPRSGFHTKLVDGNLIIGTSGKGIDFSATAGTGTSELLNDYEEGTWTPVATGLTNVGAVTYTATYTKIGRVVYINLKVAAVTSTTSVANTTFFSGLPFTPALNSTITAVDEGNITSLGVGLIATGSTVFTPNWTAVQNTTLSGFYYV